MSKSKTLFSCGSGRLFVYEDEPEQIWTQGDAHSLAVAIWKELARLRSKDTAESIALIVGEHCPDWLAEEAQECQRQQDPGAGQYAFMRLAVDAIHPILNGQE